MQADSDDFYLDVSVRNHHRASEMDPEGRCYPRNPLLQSRQVANPTTGMENCSKLPKTTSLAPPGSESADFYLEASVRNHHQASELDPGGRYCTKKTPNASCKVAIPPVEIKNCPNWRRGHTPGSESAAIYLVQSFRNSIPTTEMSPKGPHYWGLVPHKL